MCEYKFSNALLLYTALYSTHVHTQAHAIQRQLLIAECRSTLVIVNAAQLLCDDVMMMSLLVEGWGVVLVSLSLLLELRKR